LAVVSVSAADGPVIKFSDVNPRTAARIISRSPAPTVSVAVNYNVGPPMKARRTGFVHLRAHDVHGIENVGDHPASSSATAGR
jgi:hypothetical protein